MGMQVQAHTQNMLPPPPPPNRFACSLVPTSSSTCKCTGLLATHQQQHLCMHRLACNPSPAAPGHAPEHAHTIPAAAFGHAAMLHTV
jgi:hypothetical protein